MIAGLAGIAAPACAFTLPPGKAAFATGATPANMVVSGRVVGPDGKPLAGAAIAALNSTVNATTDADGRFVFTTTAPHAQDRLQSFDCRISHAAHSTRQSRIDFSRAHVQRDETGTWRAALGLNLA